MLCVQPFVGCEGTLYATVAAAVRAADTLPGPDVVRIGPGVHNLRDGVVVSASDTELEGSGQGQTILTMDGPERPESFGSTLTIVSGYMAAVRDMTLRLPSLVVGLNGAVEGLDVNDGVVERVTIDAEGAVFGPSINDGEGRGILLRRGTLRDVTVAFDLAQDAQGI